MKVLQGDGGPISSPAAQPEPDIRMTSELFVKFEEKVIRLDVCASHDTVSVLFGKVFEKLHYSPSPSRIFYLRIGVRFWKQMGGKSWKQGEYWKQEDAESTTTTLSEAGCYGQEGLTLLAHEVQVELIPLSIAMEGVSSLLVDVHLKNTSLVGLAALVQDHIGMPVVHFIFGTDNLNPSSILRHRSLGSFGIKEDSTLVAAFSCTVEAAYAKKAAAAAAAAAASDAAAAAASDDAATASDDAAAAEEEKTLPPAPAAAAAAAVLPAPRAPTPASTPATSVSLIPLWGPEKYGVWQGRVVDGVAELREYLLAHWSPSGGKLPMHGCSHIYCYVEYAQTAAKYDRTSQLQNTLRWSHSVTRAR